MIVTVMQPSNRAAWAVAAAVSAVVPVASMISSKTSLAR